MAFEKIKFAMKTWKDAVSGGTPITAAELNRIEKGISDCATQTNTLGDSVSLKATSALLAGGRLTFVWKFGTGVETGLSVKIDGSEVAFIGAGTHTKG